MNTKQLTILGVVVAVLLVAVAVKQWWPRTELYQEETQSLEIRLNAEAIDRLTIAKGVETSGGIELTRIDGVWRLPALWNAKADADKVRRVMERLGALAGEARGSSESLFEDFGISDDKALHVTLFQQGQEALHLLIGTAKPGWDQLFVRRANSPTVFLCQSTLVFSELGIFGDLDSAQLRPESWADMRFLAFAPETIERIELQEGAGEWRELTAQPSGERDEQEVKTYLENLLTLRATSVADPQGAGYGFEPPAWQFRLTTKDGQAIVLTVGGFTADAGTERYVKVTDAPAVFVVSSHALEQIKSP